MNTDNKNYQITRREALCSLAALPMITFGLTIPDKTVPSVHYGSVIAQCTASVEACWELGKSSEASDVMLAFQSASKYQPLLETIARQSSQHRKEALDLATRYALLVGVTAHALRIDCFLLPKETLDSTDNYINAIESLLYEIVVYSHWSPSLASS